LPSCPAGSGPRKFRGRGAGRAAELLGGARAGSEIFIWGRSWSQTGLAKRILWEGGGKRLEASRESQRVFSRGNCEGEENQDKKKKETKIQIKSHSAVSIYFLRFLLPLGATLLGDTHLPPRTLRLLSASLSLSGLLKFAGFSPFFPPRPLSAEIPARAAGGRDGSSAGLQRGAQRSLSSSRNNNKNKAFIFKKCHLQSVHIIWTPQYYIQTQDIFFFLKKDAFT